MPKRLLTWIAAIAAVSAYAADFGLKPGRRQRPPTPDGVLRGRVAGDCR